MGWKSQGVKRYGGDVAVLGCGGVAAWQGSGLYIDNIRRMRGGGCGRCGVWCGRRGVKEKRWWSGSGLWE